MRYTLLLHWPEMTTEELGAEGMAHGRRAFAAYGAALEQAGVLLSAEVLQTSLHTTTVRGGAGGPLVQDGPFADTKEQLGGIVVIDVPDLDAALDWARQAPAAEWGAVEVRPGATRYAQGGWQPVT